jgi:hypothetical protein
MNEPLTASPKTFSSWAESKSMRPRTVAYEAMRLAWEGGRLAERLSDNAPTPEMVQAAMNEAVAQGLVPATQDGPQAERLKAELQIQLHARMAAVLSSALKARAETSSAKADEAARRKRALQQLTDDAQEFGLGY